MYQYDKTFYDLAARFAEQSARRVVPIVQEAVRAASVVDFGCAEGAWLKVWKENGAEILGVDGDYVKPERLMVARGEFVPADLNGPIRLGRRFDLAQSLETAEHLPASAAADFVETLVSHADFVLFSAAVPGQGGEYHINEQPADYWRNLFRAHDYVAIDLVRPHVQADSTVKRWYRYNTLLYARRDALPRLPASARRMALADDASVPNVWPAPWRVQHALLGAMPRGAVRGVELLARLGAAIRR